MEKPKLKWYQDDAVKFAESHDSFILRAPTGAGKTVIGASIANNHQDGRGIVVCTAIVQSKWESELRKWGSHDRPILQTSNDSKSKRIHKYDKFTHGRQDKILIVRYGQLLKDADELAKLVSKHPIKFIIFDEAHNLRSRDSQRFKVAKRLCSRIPIKVLATASDQAKGPQDLWTALHLCNNKLFSSYWNYIKTYFVYDEYEDVIKGVKKSKADDLRKLTSNYLLTISKDDVNTTIPTVIRHKLPCVLDDYSKELYNQIQNNSTVRLTKYNTILQLTELDRQLNLRKLLISPKLLDDSLPYGNRITTIHQAAESTDKNIVIFTPFVTSIPIIRQFFSDHGYTHITSIHGGLRNEVVSSRITAWECEAAFSNGMGNLLICSIKFSEGFDLPLAHTAYFIQYEWNFERNAQAEGRLARGDKSHVDCYYVFPKGTIADHMLSRMNINKAAAGVI